MANSFGKQSIGSDIKKSIAVLISDVHYSLNNIELADKAFRAAIDKAAELKLPLIDCGDLTNDKAILRGEVINRLIETMHYAKLHNVKIFMLVGNHSLINEKGKEHVLNFLRPYAEIIDSPLVRDFPHNVVGGSTGTKVMLIPYQNDFLKCDFISHNKKVNLDHGIQSPKIMICHQGFLGAAMGDYIQDKTSIDPELVKDFTVISGHYHRHQTIGTVTYIGSPFTMSFGEANDGPKGFLVLNSDGSFTREILELRKHIKIECGLGELVGYLAENDIIFKPEDLVWLKVSGPQSELIKFDKKWIGDRLIGHSNFKLDLIPTDSAPTTIDAENLTSEQVLDTLIDGTTESDEQKQYLKGLWRETIKG